MKITKNIAKLFLGALLATGFASCDEDGYEDYNQSVEARPAVALSGEWYITISDEASGTVYGENLLHKTYDSNDGQLWITDRAPSPVDYNGFGLETKMNYNAANLTFSSNNSENLIPDSGATVIIEEGKILKNAARSTDGNVTDSIYFKLKYGTDPQVLILAGHKRTGFLEDEH